ncbi:MAG: oxidoreductase [Tagaea sp. CACIAM 22H2]|nr:oxidoreductase [Tagaea sp. CACIAM 22H2]
MAQAAQWTDARVRAIRDVTHDVREFEIVPENGAILTYAPGAHIDVGVMVADAPQTRSYSLIGVPGGDCYRIAVKRVSPSRGGSAYMWRLAPGDRLRATEPKSAFAVEFGRAAYLLIAGGIGITPLVGMAQMLAKRGADVRMLYAVRSDRDLAFAETLRDALGDRLDLRIGGQIDFVAEFAKLKPGTVAALCGPIPMLEAARGAWEAAKLPIADLRWETFGSSGRMASAPFKVRVPSHDLEFDVPADASLLDALRKAGIDAISDCRKGECGLCAMDVVACEGEIDHRDVFLSPEEKAHGRKLCVCVSRARGVLTLDSGWRPDAI